MLTFASCFVVALAAQAPVVPAEAVPPTEPAPAPAAPSAAPQTMAVLPVTAQQVPLDELIILQGAVRAEVAALGVEVQPESETSAHLSAALKIGAACVRTSTDCMTKVGLLADATQVLAPTAIARGDGTVLDLRLVDVETGKEIAHVVDLLVGDEAARRARIAKDVRRVLRPSTTRGEVLVSVNVPDARILVDDVDRGLSPPPGVFEMAPGEHRVRVTKAGFYPFDTTVLVRPRETVPVLVDLVDLPKVEPEPPPSATVRGWNKLGGVIAGGGIGVCGTAVGCLSLTPVPIFLATGAYLEWAQEQYVLGREPARKDPVTSPELVSAFSSANNIAGALMILIGVPGLAVGGTVVGTGAYVLASATVLEAE